jgi:hypothetical protein
MANEERLQILDMIASGKITPQQGVELLSALDNEEDRVEELAAGEVQPSVFPEPRLAEATADEPTSPVVGAAAEAPAGPTPPVSQARFPVMEGLPENPSFDPRANKWRGWWRIPLWIGVVATVLTGLLMYSIYSAGGFGFWFACSWFPFLISVMIVALAWASRSAHWIHIRVHQSPGERPQNIAISFPIPLGLMAWFLRTFRSKIPNMEGVNPDEMILALNHVTSDKPFYVEVNEEDGERVEVYIG